MTMRPQPIDRDRRSEPAFEPPPRVAGLGERRLAGKAAALWTEARAGRAMPFALTYELGRLDAADGIDANTVVLAMTGAGVTVEAVTPGIAAAFGIVPGRLVAGREGDLAGALHAACAVLRRDAVEVPIEGIFRGADPSATLLARGVVLPLADRRGHCIRAHAVVAWRELLSGAAAAALRRELASALGENTRIRADRDVFRH